MTREGSVIVLEIAPFPGLDKFCPCHGVEDILRRILTGVGIFGRILFQVITRGLPRIRGHSLCQDPSFDGTVILTRNLNLVVRHFGIYKIPFKLFLGRSGPDNGCRQVSRIGYEQLNNAPLIAFKIFGNVYQPGFISDAAEFNLVSLHHNDGKNSLVIGKCSPVLSLHHNTHGRDALKAVRRHHDAIKLDNRILKFIELGFQCEGQAEKYEV